MQFLYEESAVIRSATFSLATDFLCVVHRDPAVGAVFFNTAPVKFWSNVEGEYYAVATLGSSALVAAIHIAEPGRPQCDRPGQIVELMHARKRWKRSGGRTEPQAYAQIDVGAPVYKVCLSPTRMVAATESYINVYDLENETRLLGQILTADNVNMVCELSPSPDSPFLVYCNRNTGYVNVFDTAAMELVTAYNVYDSGHPVGSVAFEMSGNVFATTSPGSKFIHVWWTAGQEADGSDDAGVAGQKRLYCSKDTSMTGQSFAPVFDQTGMYMAAAAADGTVKVFGLDDGMEGAGFSLPNFFSAPKDYFRVSTGTRPLVGIRQQNSQVLCLTSDGVVYVHSQDTGALLDSYNVIVEAGDTRLAGGSSDDGQDGGSSDDVVEDLPDDNGGEGTSDGGGRLGQSTMIAAAPKRRVNFAIGA